MTVTAIPKNAAPATPEEAPVAALLKGSIVHWAES